MKIAIHVCLAILTGIAITYGMQSCESSTDKHNLVMKGAVAR